MDYNYDPMPLPARPMLSDEESLARARAYYESVRLRHSVRHFSDRPLGFHLREYTHTELAAELESQTGVGIDRRALDELARRTLQTARAKRGAAAGAAADSTARFAAEYRKLAALTAGGRITRRRVEEAVEDRGEEDVWKILDALGSGRGGEALRRFRRLLAAADDPLASRLSFFALLAAFCRQLTAVYDQEVLSSEGMRIYTTLDLKVHNKAEKWVEATALVPHRNNPSKAASNLGVPYAS